MQTGEDFPEFVARSAEPSQVTDVQAAIDVQVDVPELLKHVCLAWSTHGFLLVEAQPA